MFVIFGTKVTRKIIGYQGQVRCGRCNNITPWQVMKVTHWFSLFFIPLIPMSIKFYEMCPICSGATQITREEALSYVVSEDINND